MPSPEYIEQLQEAILAVHGCESRHVTTSCVKEVFEGQVAWEGEVETFLLIGHPKAKLCHAWGYDDDDGMFRSTAVLELPPVDSPGMAVTVAIAAKANSRK
jgi:hypothetical protein